MEKMRMSLSFKEQERYMWDYLKTQLNASYYIKQLIHNDIYKTSSPTAATSFVQEQIQEQEQTKGFDLLAIEF